MNNGSMLNGKRDFTLEYELWMWRGRAIFLLLMLLVVNFITFTIDRNQHARDNVERARAWQMLYDKADRNRAMIMKNYEQGQAVERALARCSECHSHADKGR